LGNINCCIGQDSVQCTGAHRACLTIELLQRETQKFILHTFGFRTVLILVLLTVEYGA